MWFHVMASLIRCKGTHTFYKGPLLSLRFSEYFPKSLENHEDILCSMQISLCVLLGCPCFWSWNSTMEAIFGFFITELWPKTSIEASEALDVFLFLSDFLDESLMSFWSNFGVILVGQALLEGSPLQFQTRPDWFATFWLNKWNHTLRTTFCSVIFVWY